MPQGFLLSPLLPCPLSRCQTPEEQTALLSPSHCSQSTGSSQPPAAAQREMGRSPLGYWESCHAQRRPTRETPLGASSARQEEQPTKHRALKQVLPGRQHTQCFQPGRHHKAPRQGFAAAEADVTATRAQHPSGRLAASIYRQLSNVCVCVFSLDKRRPTQQLSLPVTSEPSSQQPCRKPVR